MSAIRERWRARLVSEHDEDRRDTISSNLRGSTSRPTYESHQDGRRYGTDVYYRGWAQDSLSKVADLGVSVTDEGLYTRFIRVLHCLMSVHMYVRAGIGTLQLPERLETMLKSYTDLERHTSLEPSLFDRPYEVLGAVTRTESTTPSKNRSLTELTSIINDSSADARALVLSDVVQILTRLLQITIIDSVIVYTALAWRNKAFGNGTSFAWAGDSNTYAVLEGRMKVRVYKNFRERGGAGMKGAGSWSIDGLHGGPLLGARGSNFVVFWDWESGEIVRRIEADAKNVSFSNIPKFN